MQTVTLCCLLASAHGFSGLAPRRGVASGSHVRIGAPLMAERPAMQAIKSSLGALAAALLIAAPPVPAILSPAMAADPPAIAKEAASKTPSRRYINLTGFPFPLGPFTERQTVQTEIVPGKVYSFEQEQKLSGITANVRSVVFRMRDNHLLVYNPVAPTDEFLRQLDALDHAGISHILLGATTCVPLLAIPRPLLLAIPRPTPGSPPSPPPQL